MGDNPKRRNFSKDELRKRVDEVLFYVWDPISVSEEPFARAEYEEYVPRVLEMLKLGNASGIAKFLEETELTTMGLSRADTEKCQRVAELLLMHKEAIEEGCA